ncbi:MAG TPA: hypothetical protein VGJ97_08335 [Anaerolineaceae bacterium]|jgi:hypothetical protein
MIPIVNAILSWEKELEIRDEQYAMKHVRPDTLRDRAETYQKPERKAPRAIFTWLRRQPTQDCTGQPCQ